MTRIYLLRHGQTQFNQKNLIQGSCDSKLTPLGISQAKNTKVYLDKINFDAVYCSTSERTLDTAIYATGNKYPITPCKEFKEIDFGNVEGEDGSLLFKGMDNKDFITLLLNEGWSSLDGETGTDFTKRIFTKLNELVNQYPDGNILIATHGGTILNIVANIDPKYLKADGPDNCSITIIDWCQKYQIVDYNLKVNCL